jgi:hypothetical protein
VLKPEKPLRYTHTVRADCLKQQAEEISGPIKPILIFLIAAVFGDDSLNFETVSFLKLVADII